MSHSHRTGEGSKHTPSTVTVNASSTSKSSTVCGIQQNTAGWYHRGNSAFTETTTIASTNHKLVVPQRTASLPCNDGSNIQRTEVHWHPSNCSPPQGYIAGQLPAAHALSGCDTVAQLWGIGKTRVVKVLRQVVSCQNLGIAVQH